eukprot:gene29121-32339_t
MDNSVSQLFDGIEQDMLLVAASVPLYVVNVDCDGQFMSQTTEAWQEIGYSGAAYLRLFAPYVAGVDVIPSVLPPVPYLTVVEAFGLMVGTGRLFSPNGYDLDCFIRAFFIGHQHVAVIKRLCDMFYATAEAAKDRSIARMVRWLRTQMQCYIKKRFDGYPEGRVPEDLKAAIFRADGYEGCVPSELGVFLGNMLNIPVIIIGANKAKEST